MNFKERCKTFDYDYIMASIAGDPNGRGKSILDKFKDAGKDPEMFKDLIA